MAKCPVVELGKIYSLHNECKKGNIKGVMAALSEGRRVNDRDQRGKTPLIIACKNGPREIIEILLEKNADVNVQDNYGDTPLIIASKNGRREIIEILLENEADVNVQDNLGETPLISASKNGHREVIEILLENNADVNVQDNCGWSAIHFSCRNKSTEIIELLLENGADYNIKTNFGKTPLHLACRYGYLNVAKKFLEKGADYNIRDIYRICPIHEAISSTNINIVKLLVENGANVNVSNYSKLTPLLIAMKKPWTIGIEYLLKTGANPNFEDENGNTSLDLAITTMYNPGICIPLLSFGAEAKKVSLIRDEWCLLPVLDSLITYTFDYSTLKLTRSKKIYAHGVIDKQIIKLHVANVFTDDQIKDWLNVIHNYRGLPHLSRFKDKCIQEIERLKIEMISDCTISLYDFVFKTVNKLSTVFKNENVLRTDISDWNRKFPIYWKILKYKFKQSYNKLTLINSCVTHFNILLEDKPYFLPALASIKIFKYLRSCDQRNFVDAFYIVDDA